LSSFIPLQVASFSLLQTRLRQHSADPLPTAVAGAKLRTRHCFRVQALKKSASLEKDVNEETTPSVTAHRRQRMS